MPPKLFKATDVCDLAKVQPYVLRSWEKEFPGIGVQSADGPRLYRQSDVDQVLRIKQLVFGEGLTVSGARRRLEESAPATAATNAAEAAEVLDTLGKHARTKIASVRDGLRAIHALLSKGVGEFELQPPPMGDVSRRARVAGKKTAAAASLRVAPRDKKAGVAAGVSRKKVVAKNAAPAAKRRRANA